jgi:hypothetical protein
MPDLDNVYLLCPLERVVQAAIFNIVIMCHDVLALLLIGGITVHSYIKKHFTTAKKRGQPMALVNLRLLLCARI